MQIDSTPLDVLVRLDDAVVGRVEMTGMIDVATRTVTAAVLRPTTKALDASVLLARTVTPEPMRPGWVDALRMSHSVLPFTRLLSIDERLAHAAARLVIVPETIVCDHGKVFISRAFRSSCRFLGINFQPAHKGTPTDKPHVERMLGSVATLFAQFVTGYTGSNVERRGVKVEDGPLWSMLELQELLDEWLVAAWQNRPHDELRDPAAPGRAFTRTRSTPRWSRRQGTCRWRYPPTTTSSCSRPVGRRSTLTASGSTAAPTTTRGSTRSVGSVPESRRRRGYGRSTTIRTTCRGCGCATTAMVAVASSVSLGPFCQSARVHRPTVQSCVRQFGTHHDGGSRNGQQRQQ
ncbi:hypothetical protein [Dactylosporangium sp. CA-233914]|uniref:hypothetical protein n=1 Tax=Dactylosporangium sp. CA-233914 TaxID=3239934 RepID=UPI003D8B44DA